ncbi:carbon starvation protein A, partial [Klebsiella pneumoniae]|nr:carbon starvation protein A [Klebsiella pneumoniae]
PVGVVESHPMTPIKRLMLVAIGLLGGVAWTIIAIVRGENPNAVWFVIAAVCTYIFAFRFYARLIERKIVFPRDDRATPAEILENGKDYMPTD